MVTTQAAVVSVFGNAPEFMPFELPDPQGAQLLVGVLAVGLHPRVRSAAAGRHYTSTGRLPMVPGVDGVARTPDGRVVYFVADDDVIGTLAEQAILDPRRSLALPAGVDDANVATIAAAMNPAMSSWVAFRRRVQLQPGQSVLVLGATGNAGGMAVQVAELLGAGRVIGAGRDAARLAALVDRGADAVVRLTDDPVATAAALAEAAGEVDVVLDYLWGEPAAHAMTALLTHRADRGRQLNWVQIGSVAGPSAPVPSVALRSADFRIQGVGQGAVSPRDYLAQLPSLIEQILAGRLSLPTRTVPLAEVHTVWTEPETPGVRTVLIP